MSNDSRNKNSIKVLGVILMSMIICLIVLVIVLLIITQKNGGNTGNLFGKKDVKADVKLTKTPTPTSTPTATPTLTPTPTSTPTPMPAYINDAVDGRIKEVLVTFGEGATVEVFDEAGIYRSAVVQNKDQTEKYPLTFNVTSGEEMTAKSMFKVAYLAVVKEKLQTYVLTVDDAFKGTSFTTYKEAYKPTDYDRFYIDGNKLVFWFSDKSLTGSKHKSFAYETELSDAEKYMIVNTKGEKTGYKPREGLDPSKPMVALTYDDGPFLKTEKNLAKVLKKYNACCTFFSLGTRFDWHDSIKEPSYGENLLDMVANGCEIASHTYTHSANATQSGVTDYFNDEFFAGGENRYKKFWTELNQNTVAIADLLGYASDLIRMPGGFDRHVYEANTPAAMINWSWSTDDWNNRGKKKGETSDDAYKRKVQETYDAIVKHSTDGAIILCHSIYDHTVEASDLALKELTEKGIQFVTVSELFYYKGVSGVAEDTGKTYDTKHLEPGLVYYSPTRIGDPSVRTKADDIKEYKYDSDSRTWKPVN